MGSSFGMKFIFVGSIILLKESTFEQLSPRVSAYLGRPENFCWTNERLQNVRIGITRQWIIHTRHTTTLHLIRAYPFDCMCTARALNMWSASLCANSLFLFDVVRKKKKTQRWLLNSTSVCELIESRQGEIGLRTSSHIAEREHCTQHVVSSISLLSSLRHDNFMNEDNVILINGN